MLSTEEKTDCLKMKAYCETKEINWQGRDKQRRGKEDGMIVGKEEGRRRLGDWVIILCEN